MSADEKVTKELMKTLEDGRLGYEQAAERLSSEQSSISLQLSAEANRRFEMYTELQNLALSYGDELEESGSVAAAVHRGWLAVKDSLASNSIAAVLGAALTGENYSIEQYEEALAADLSDEFRPVVQRQLEVLRTALCELENWAAGVKN